MHIHFKNKLDWLFVGDDDLDVVVVGVVEGTTKTRKN